MAQSSQFSSLVATHRYTDPKEDTDTDTDTVTPTVANSPYFDPFHCFTTSSSPSNGALLFPPNPPLLHGSPFLSHLLPSTIPLSQTLAEIISATTPHPNLATSGSLSASIFPCASRLSPRPSDLRSRSFSLRYLATSFRHLLATFGEPRSKCHTRRRKWRRLSVRLLRWMRRCRVGDRYRLWFLGVA